MKRRLTALALALGLTFTLAACGGGTGGTANTPSNNSESPAGNSETPVAESDMAYVKGFGWLEYQGPNHCEYGADIYENGNKIGIMG